MKKGITIALAVFVVMVGMAGASLNTGGLTSMGLQVQADVAERQASGFVQFAGGDSEVEVITYKAAPFIYYSRCFAAYPDNVAGFDTPMERAYIYQGMLNDKIASMDTLSKQYSQSGGVTAYQEFYQAYYQDLQNKYQKMYCGVGNKVIGDFDCYLVTGNISVGNGSA